MEEAKRLGDTGSQGEEKAYLIAVSFKILVLIKSQCEPGVIFKNDNDRIGKVLLLQKIEKMAMNRLLKTKLLLKPLERHQNSSDTKKNMLIVNTFSFKCSDKNSFFYRFGTEDIQSALTLMIAEDGNADKVCDAKTKDLTDEAKDNLLHRITMRSITSQDSNGIEQMASDVRNVFAVPFKYLMENIACRNVAEETEHQNNKAVHMMVAALARASIPSNEPILQTLASMDLARDPNLLCIVAAIAVIQPDYPRKPYPKEVNSNKRRYVASLLLMENCEMTQYFSYNENLPKIQANEAPPVPYQAPGPAGGNGQGDVIFDGLQRGGKQHHQRGGSFRGHYGKRAKYDGPASGDSY